MYGSIDKAGFDKAIEDWKTAEATKLSKNTTHYTKISRGQELRKSYWFLSGRLLVIRSSLRFMKHRERKRIMQDVHAVQSVGKGNRVVN